MSNKKFEKKKKTAGLVILLVLLSVLYFKFYIATTEKKDPINDKLNASVPDPSIKINDLGSNDWAWAATQTWFGGGSGSSSDPYILKDLVINGEGVDDCITIKNSKAYFIIRNCTVYNGDGTYGLGILLENVTNGKITTCNCSNNAKFGIVIVNSETNTISESIIESNNVIGLYIVQSNITIISNNSIYDHEYGIYADESFWTEIVHNHVQKSNIGYGIRILHSHSNLISGNEVRKCLGGINIHDINGSSIVDNTVHDNEKNGINVYSCNNNGISANSIQNSSINGIFIKEHSSNNQFINNQITDNLESGINVSNSTGNLFSLNYFVGNKIHALDYGAKNNWNNTLIGNYWDNYTDTDSNYDGIGDTPYDIPGDAGSKDYLPIWDDHAPIIHIILPKNNSKVGKIAPEFEIEIIEPNLDSMWYTIDDGLTNITFTSNGTIDQTSWENLWDSLVKGDTITLMFYANDTFGHLGFTSIELKKKVPSVIGTNPLITMIFLLIFGGTAVIGIIAKLHNKNFIKSS